MVKVDCSCFHDGSSLQPALLHALIIASLHAWPSGSDSVINNDSNLLTHDRCFLTSS